ncbi:thiamine ABC transporter substrate-binding protein [Nitriliruptoraceae bacterium ZYF776]|nr:thiamine ABC transporter substrate-binding protein [Profundirhabdus halotolerans]
MRRSPLPAALLAGTLLLAACGDADPTDEAAPDEPSASSDAADGGSEDVTLTLLTHDSFDVSEEVLASFTQDTGIEVQVVPSGDAGTALNQAILTRDTPQGDLLFGVDTTFLSRALDEDLFVAYRSPELDRVPEDLHVAGDAATPIDVGDVCLNYDVAALEDAGLPVPTSLEDLRDEAYAGELVVQNPATSSPGLAFVLATVEEFGEDGYLDFWADLRDHDVVVTDGWSEAYYDEFSGSGQGGDRSLVVSYASSPAAEVVFADPPVDAPPTGVIEASCVRQVEHIGILDGTEHEEAAQQLVDFLLSRTFQEDVPLTMFVYPVVEDAELPEVFEEHAQLPADPYVLDPAAIGDTREDVIEAWTATVLR